jgi:hypothetical protein
MGSNGQQPLESSHFCSAEELDYDAPAAVLFSLPWGKIFDALTGALLVSFTCGQLFVCGEERWC